MALHKKSLLTIGVIVLTIVLWSLLLYFVGADQIVAYIGVKNGYLIMFFIALFGGMSSFSGATYAATVLTLASGGLDPLFLAAASGAGISIGDTIYFYLGRHGRKMVTKTRIADLAHRFSDWLEQRSKLVVAAGIYVYTAFSPLPNDVLTITMGVSRQPYLWVIIPLILGNFTMTYLLSIFGANAMHLF